MKVLERLVLAHLRPLVKSSLDPLQFEYWPRVGVDDAIIYLLQRAQSHLDGTIKCTGTGPDKQAQLHAQEEVEEEGTVEEVEEEEEEGHHIIISLTPSTLSIYWTAWNSFCFFYTTFNLQFPSFDVASVCSFISCAHSTLHIKIPTTKVYLSGINFFSKLVTGSPSTLSQLALLIKGLQHQTPPPTPRLLPLTTDLISRCIVTLRSNHFSTHLACTLQSMFLLTFYGFLRCSEFASSSAKFNPSLHPCIFNLYPISEDS
ncbi:uncharacterized protein [Embiotoca jacksoni]|uniref:uncharacterized protein n=1 Tax=Embiotoca jacksoni TaxID=100190 RepID=UPI0037042827